MTLHNSLHTGSASHAVLSALDGRLALSGLIAPAAAGPGALDVGTGVMFPAPGGFAVSGTSSTSPWQYSVPAATFVTTKGTLDGGKIGSNDGVYLVSTVVPPASNSRYDVIYVMQQDADATINPDASTAPVIGVVNGTAAASPTIPAIPAGAYQLAHAQVFSTAIAGTSGAGVTITQDWSWTSLRGTPIPFRNATEQNAVTWGSAAVPALGMRIDLGTLVINRGAGWVEVAKPTARCRVTRSSTQALTSGTVTSVIFDASDTHGSPSTMWSSGSPTQIVTPWDGWWNITANVAFDVNATGFRLAYIAAGGTRVAEGLVAANTASAAPTTLSMSASVWLPAGTAVTLQVDQTSGGSLNIITSELVPALNVVSA